MEHGAPPDAAPAWALDQVLADLPAGHLRARWGVARLVVGPNGLFVVVPGGDDVWPAGRLAARLAERSRARLAEHLAFVPFVDALVAARPTPDTRHSRAAVVALDLLRQVLVEGPRLVPPDALATTARLLHAGALESWVADPSAPAGTIDLCPLPPATVPST